MCWMRLWAEGHLTQNCFVCFYFYVDQFYVVVKRRIFLKEIKLGKSIILSNVKDHCANDVELPECSDSTWRAKCVCVCVRGFVIDLCTVLDAYVLLKAANLSLPSSTLLKTFSPPIRCGDNSVFKVTAYCENVRKYIWNIQTHQNGSYCAVSCMEPSHVTEHLYWHFERVNVLIFVLLTDLETHD